MELTLNEYTANFQEILLCTHQQFLTGLRIRVLGKIFVVTTNTTSQNPELVKINTKLRKKYVLAFGSFQNLFCEE